MTKSTKTYILGHNGHASLTVFSDTTASVAVEHFYPSRYSLYTDTDVFLFLFMSKSKEIKENGGKYNSSTFILKSRCVGALWV